MDSAATYCGTVYPWQCDHVGHMNIMWYVGKFDEANWNLFARANPRRLQIRFEGPPQHGSPSPSRPAPKATDTARAAG